MVRVVFMHTIENHLVLLLAKTSLSQQQACKKDSNLRKYQEKSSMFLVSMRNKG